MAFWKVEITNLFLSLSVIILYSLRSAMRYGCPFGKIHPPLPVTRPLNGEQLDELLTFQGDPVLLQCLRQFATKTTYCRVRQTTAAVLTVCFRNVTLLITGLLNNNSCQTFQFQPLLQFSANYGDLHDDTHIDGMSAKVVDPKKFQHLFFSWMAFNVL